MNDSNIKPSITIVGAGFSGLTTAYYLSKQGFACQIYEKSESAGGLISSVNLPYGIAENGALTLMATDLLLNLCKDLEVELIPANPQHKKKFYRQKVTQWPLSHRETLSSIFKFIKNVLVNKLNIKPRAYETLFHWVERIVGMDVGKFFLFPALQGIYAGDPKELSASLIFNKNKVQYRGLYAPAGGMQTLIEKLVQRLYSVGVKIKYNVLFEDSKSNETIIWCTSAQDNPYTKNKIDSIPLVSATLFFEKNKNEQKGFGCLLPRAQGLNSLGVLFNSNIFSDRAQAPYFTETWLLGGAQFDSVVNLSNESILELIKNDRKLVFNNTELPVDYHIIKRNSALPNYNIKLEKVLETFKMPENQYANGNYVAGIGLSKILENSKSIAERIYNENLRVSQLS